MLTTRSSPSTYPTVQHIFIITFAFNIIHIVTRNNVMPLPRDCAFVAFIIT